MDGKNYTEVLINGNAYTLGGAEDPEYMQKVIYLNLADDYFKTLQEAMMLRSQKDEMEKEIYSLKHELIGLQMKQESAEKKAE